MLMDATVDDFLNEINQIAPKKQAPITAGIYLFCFS